MDKTNIIAVYTMMLILKKMRQELGLDACLEYMDAFSTTIGNKSVNLDPASRYILERVDVHKIYKEMMQEDKTAVDFDY